MNFLLMLVPFSFFLVLCVLSFTVTPKFDTRKIRELSKYYYFVHPVCIVMVEEIGKAFHINILSSGIVSFLLVFLLTHVLCLAIIIIQQQKLKYSFIALAALLGIAVTFILATVIYQFKLADIIVKFELVPCLWVFSSFGIYFLLFQWKKRKSKSIKEAKV